MAGYHLRDQAAGLRQAQGDLRRQVRRTQLHHHRRRHAGVLVDRAEGPREVRGHHQCRRRSRRRLRHPGRPRHPGSDLCRDQQAAMGFAADLPVLGGGRDPARRQHDPADGVRAPTRDRHHAARRGLHDLHRLAVPPGGAGHRGYCLAFFRG